jgi:hypothetical protein
VTGYGKLILAEFDYDGPRRELPLRPVAGALQHVGHEGLRLPELYWNGMLRGRRTEELAREVRTFLGDAVARHEAR